MLMETKVQQIQTDVNEMRRLFDRLANQQDVVFQPFLDAQKHFTTLAETVSRFQVPGEAVHQQVEDLKQAHQTLRVNEDRRQSDVDAHEAHADWLLKTIDTFFNKTHAIMTLDAELQQFQDELDECRDDPQAIKNLISEERLRTMQKWIQDAAACI